MGVGVVHHIVVVVVEKSVVQFAAVVDSDTHSDSEQEISKEHNENDAQQNEGHQNTQFILI